MQRFLVAGEIPILYQIIYVQQAPLLNEAHRLVTHGARYFTGLDNDGYFLILVLGMKMSRAVISPMHVDNNTEKT